MTGLAATAGIAAACVLAVLPWAMRRRPGGRATTADRTARSRERRRPGTPGNAETGIAAAGGGVAGVAAAGGAMTGGLVRSSLRIRPRAARRQHDEADPALLLDLVAVALAAGAPVPAALLAVGTSWPGPTGQGLVRAARALELGAPWDVAWTGASAGSRALAGALEPAWTVGASPAALLRTAADQVRSRRRAQTKVAAGRLGVRLLIPLAVCYLPAFVLVGLVPVIVSLASGLFG